MLSAVAAVLGLLMFVWGFLRWLKVGDAQNGQQKYSGYAFAMPTTAIIGFSVAAGLIALLGMRARRPGRALPSEIATALAGTSLLLAIGVWLGKGSISPNVGSKVGVEIGLVLALITALLQTIVLAMAMASGHDLDDRLTDDHRARQRT
jgi:hypothetical protein